MTTTKPPTLSPTNTPTLSTAAVFRTDYEAFWPLDGKAQDYSGHGHHGASIGQITTTHDRYGRPNSSYHFDGASSIHGACDEFSAGELTILLWVNPDRTLTPNGAGMFSFGYGGSWESNRGALCESTIAFILNNLDSPGPQNTFEVQEGCDTNRLAYVSAPNPTGKWQHWAVTASMTGTKLYFNGAQIISNTNFVNTIDIQNKLFFIGAALLSDGTTLYSDRNIGAWYGSLDDTLVYKNELSAAEIFEIYSNQPPALNHNQFSITDGVAFIITPAMLSATDISLAQQNNLQFIISNLQNGYFDLLNAPGIPVSTFTQQQIISNIVRFVPDGSRQAPIFNIKVSDGLLWTTPTPASVTFRATPPSTQPTQGPTFLRTQQPTPQPSTLSTIKPTLSPTDASNTATSTHTTENTPSATIYIIAGVIIIAACIGGALVYYCLRKNNSSVRSYELRNFNGIPEIDSKTERVPSAPPHQDEESKHNQSFGIPKKSWRILPHDVTKLELLGEGGFGKVYKGRWQHQDVALKCYKGDGLSENDKQEIIHEITIMANLGHDHLVQLRGYVQENLMLVMTLEVNGSLRRYLENHAASNVSWSFRLRIAYELTCGLAYLHTNGIIHQDIKSANVVLDSSYRAKWCDFGLAQLIQTSQRRGACVDDRIGGTLNWMAPERFLNSSRRLGAATEASDIWALGMVFFEIASHLVPYHDANGNTAQIVEWIKQGTGETTFIENCEKEAPGFKAIMMRCWKERNSRPTATELVDEVREAKTFAFSRSP